jgi:hypothetical protein
MAVVVVGVASNALGLRLLLVEARKKGLLVSFTYV